MARVFISGPTDAWAEGYNDGGFSLAQKLHAAIRAGYTILSEGQTSVTSAGNVANQILCNFSLPIVNAGATGSVLISNTLATALTKLWGAPVAEADLGAGVTLQWWISARVAATSITLSVRNTGASNMGGAVDFSCVLIN